MCKMNLNLTRISNERIIIFVVSIVFCLVIIINYYHQSILNLIMEARKPTVNGSNDTLLTNKWNGSNPAKNTEKISLKTILIWNSPERIESIAGFGTGHEPFIDHGCPISNCFIQVNESSDFWSRATANNSEILKSYDAVVINIYKLFFLPNYERPRGQRFVWLSQESPGNEKGLGNVDANPAIFERVFNWTMTYKRDSDIQLLYGRIHPISNRTQNETRLRKERTQNETRLREERRAALVNKTGTVVWMVSHCKTRSRREDYVHQLQQHIQVDIYGECGNLSCPRSYHWTSYPECYEMIGRKYKFYLSFENALCKDYGLLEIVFFTSTVTEKFFSILELDMVPVVFGAAGYRAIAPNHSFINALDFSSPAKLAEYLHLLDSDDELYLDYLEWKSHYRVEAGAEQMARHGFCDLCAKLNQEDEPEKVYPSLIPDWSFAAQCQSGWKP